MLRDWLELPSLGTGVLAVVVGVGGLFHSLRVTGPLLRPQLRALRFHFFLSRAEVLSWESLCFGEQLPLVTKFLYF